MNHRDTEAQRDPLTYRVIGLAIEVHKTLGPGLLESVYEECLCWELKKAGIRFQRQQNLPVVYKGENLDCGFRLDLVVEGQLILEIKAVDKLLPVHEAQLLTYFEMERHKKRIIAQFP